MKRHRVLAMAFVAILFFACTTESGKGEEQPLVEEALVTFHLKGSGDDDNLQTRAAEEGTSNESAISDLIVFFFDSDYKLVGAPKFGGNATTLNLKTTPAARSAYVIANTGVNATNYGSSIFKGVTTLGLLQTVQGDLFKSPGGGTSSEDNSSMQRSGHLWMSGTANFNFTGGSMAATVPVRLTYIASKIVVRVVDNRTGNLAAGSPYLSNHSLTVLFSGAKSTLFGTEVTPQNDYYSGIATTTTTRVTTKAILNTSLAVTANSENAQKITNTFYHFYVFAQTGTAGGSKPIILTIVADRKVGSTTKKTYYPAHFSLQDVLSGKSAFGRGKLYTLTITLNGKVSDGAGGGVPDPEFPAVDATITLESATWHTTIKHDIVIN